LEESIEGWQWQTRATRASVGFDRCLELSVPWSDLHIQPDYPLHLVAVLAERGEFRDYVPENGVIFLQAP
jgi:hypothetical protein